ncbi:unnamed protein product, partial [Symbiodinium necroappetens]
AGIQTNLWEPSLFHRCPTPSLVDSVTYDAASTDIDAVVGLGHGGVLDLAKAAAAIIPLVRASAQYSPIFTRPGSGSAKPGRDLTELLVNGNMRGKGNAAGTNGINGALPKWPNAPVAESFLLGSDAKPRASTLLAGSSLPLLLVPTTAAIAATSGRCLLRPEGPEALVPLAIAGPGPYGVGVGLQATEVVADATVTQGQSARGTAAAMAHAISVFVDSAAASGGTVKQQQLMDDMMTGAGSNLGLAGFSEPAAVLGVDLISLFIAMARALVLSLVLALASAESLKDCIESKCRGCGGEQCQLCREDVNTVSACVSSCMDSLCRGCGGEQCQLCREDASHIETCCSQQGLESVTSQIDTCK